MFVPEYRLIDVSDDRSETRMIVTDYNYDGSVYSVTEYPCAKINGSVKTVDIYKGGRHYPGKLRDARLGTTRTTSQWATCRTPNIIGWGSRVWEGHFAAMAYGPYSGMMLKSAEPLNQEPNQASFDETLQRAAARIEQPDFNGNLFFGELAETVAMLRNPIRGLGRLFDSTYYRKRRKSLPKDLTDFTTGQYLQAIWGIAPLMQAIADVKKAFDLKAVKRLGRSTAGCSLSESSGYSTSYAFPGMGGVSTPFWVERKKEEKFTSRIYYRPVYEGSDIYTLVKRWGLDPVDIPATMYMVLPCSFLFDWFLNVGQWLRAVRPRTDVDMLGNYTSAKTVETVTYRPSGPCQLTIAGTPVTLHFESSFIELKGERLVRTVNRNIPLGVMQGQGINNLDKAISSAALAWQKLPIHKLF